MLSEWSQLPFEEAIAYFKGKTNLDTDTYADAQGITQDVAFTVAKAKGDLLNEIRVAVEKAIVSGQGLEVFQKAFDRIADRWSPDWLGNGDRAWRSQLVYETNLRSAYAAGRYTQMTQPEVLNKRPYWQWRHGGSKDPRPEHIALDGKVFDADQLFFQVGGFPPCGYNCRCRVFSMSPRDLSQRSLLVSDAPPVDAIVDKGWGFVPGKTDRSAILAGLPDDIRSLVMKDSSVKFAERMGLLTADYAGKKGGKGKKNCEKGKICKGSCIAKTKTCLGDMNPAQLKAHKAAQASAKKTKGGGGGAVAAANDSSPPANSIIPINTIYTIPPLSKIKLPSDKDIEKLQKDADLKKEVFDRLDPNDNATWKSVEKKELAVAQWAVSQAETLRYNYQKGSAKFEYEQERRLHKLIDNGKRSIDPSLVKRLNATPTQGQLDKLDAAKKAYDRITETGTMEDSFKSKEWRNLVKIETAIKEREGDRIEAMSTIRRQMLKMSKEDALVHAKKIDIGTSAAYIAKDIREGLTEVYMIIGPRELGLKKIVRTTDRAYADDLRKTINSGINTGSEGFKRTIFHEVGHFLEWDKSAVPLTSLWVKKRGTGPIEAMKGYSDNEKATPDHFMSPYVGKVYSSATEVVSMGLQQFHSPSAMLDLYKADREHFFLTVGLINNDKI